MWTTFTYPRPPTVHGLLKDESESPDPNADLELDDELLLETLLPLADGFGEDELASDEDPDSNDEVRAFFFSPWRRVRIP